MEQINSVANFDSDNIASSLNLLLTIVPEDLTPLEKLRWLYIKAGELFSYDYRIANNIEVAKTEIDFYKNYINRYQTCIQISYLMNLMYNNVDRNITGKVITRKGNQRGNYDVEHQANEVTLSTGEKFILDLTLDLYLIQSGCQTKEFGFSSSPDTDYDIISLRECEEMDRKLGLIKNGEYTDKRIRDLKSQLNNLDYSNMTQEEELDFKISRISSVIPSFKGYHEGKQFVNKVLREILLGTNNIAEYNLTYKHDETEDLMSCFALDTAEQKNWYVYNRALGLLKTSPTKIDTLLKGGWHTNSRTLPVLLEESQAKVK